MSEFECKDCDYKTCNRKDFKKHLDTKKHKFNKCNNYNKCINLSPQRNMVCVCGKSYNHRASLYNHKKHCKIVLQSDMGENTIVGDKINITTEMFMKLMNDNQDMIKIIKEQQQQLNAIIPKIGNVTMNNNTTTNMTNNNFNLNFFLKRHSWVYPII